MYASVWEYIRALSPFLRLSQVSFDTVWLPEREFLAATLCYRLYKDGTDHELGQRKEERMLWRKNENYSCTGWKNWEWSAAQMCLKQYDGGLNIEEMVLCKYTHVHKYVSLGWGWQEREQHDMINGRVRYPPTFTSSLLYSSSLWMSADGRGMCGPAESHDNCH